MTDTVTTGALVDLYMLRCEVEGKSPRTVAAYRWVLTRFLAALEEDHAPTMAAELASSHIYSYLARSSHLRTESRHRYFREVRCFFAWLVDAGYLERTPFRGMRNVRMPQRIVQPFSVRDVHELLAACEGPLVARDRALVMMLLDTGARCTLVLPKQRVAGSNPVSRSILG